MHDVEKTIGIVLNIDLRFKRSVECVIDKDIRQKLRGLWWRLWYYFVTVGIGGKLAHFVMFAY